MTTESRYAIGLGIVGAGALIAGLVAGPSRNAVWAAAALALVLQGPLGWWLVRHVGGQRFFHAWGAGLLARLALVGAGGTVLLVSRDPRAQAALITLAGALVALLGVEIAVLLRDLSMREDA